MLMTGDLAVTSMSLEHVAVKRIRLTLLYYQSQFQLSCLSGLANVRSLAHRKKSALVLRYQAFLKATLTPFRLSTDGDMF